MILYNTKSAYELYIYYVSMKNHFTTDYDFFKYSGKEKVRANFTSFENRSDKIHFYNLSKRKHAKELILANMLVSPNSWIGDLLEVKAEETYRKWLKRQQSLTYRFKSELGQLDEDFNQNFVVEHGQHPNLIRLYIMNRICLETLVILCELTKCLSYWEKKISEKLIFPDINNIVRKYRPFLDYDKDKMRKILLDKYNDIR